MVRLFWCPKRKIPKFLELHNRWSKISNTNFRKENVFTYLRSSSGPSPTPVLRIKGNASKGIIPFFRTHSTPMNRSIWIIPGINESSIQMLSAQFFQTAIFLPKYRRLQLPVHTRDKNMFCWPMKIQSFDNQTSKFTRPLGNVLAPLTQKIVTDLSTV